MCFFNAYVTLALCLLTASMLVTRYLHAGLSMASVPLSSKARKWLVKYLLDSHGFTAADSDDVGQEAAAVDGTGAGDVVDIAVDPKMTPVDEAASATTTTTTIVPAGAASDELVTADGASQEDSNESLLKLLGELEVFCLSVLSVLSHGSPVPSRQFVSAGAVQCLHGSPVPSRQCVSAGAAQCLQGSPVPSRQLSQLEVFSLKPRDRLSSKTRDFLSKNPDQSVGPLKSIALDQLHVALFAAKRDLVDITANLPEEADFVRHTRALATLVEAQVH